MRLIPRGDEVAEIAAILNDDHESAEACAKEVIKAVAGLLWFRDWWAIYTPDNFGFGPFASQAEAVAIATKYKGVLVPASDKGHAVLKLHGLGGTTEERLGGGFGFCIVPGCGHPAYTHSMIGTSRGKCILSTCDCAKYESAKPKPKTTRKKVTS